MKGIIFNIQRFAVHDGPGIRTLVFLKGCPLHCHWCCNPEGQKSEIELSYVINHCRLCGRCEAVCDQGAINIIEKRVLIRRDLCDLCGNCVENCLSGALKIVGKQVDVETVLDEVKRDEPFYRYSGGGLTVSGGEPTLQNNFLVELLKGAHQEGFNTAIETSGFCKWENIESILNIVDHFLFDVKHVSDEKHKMFTGVSNKIVLENLLRLIHKGVNVIVRVPLIPSFNCDEDDLRKIMSFLSEFLKKGSQIHLLPYHRFGLPKYDHIGDDNKMVLFEKINKSHIERATQIVNEFNFIANVGGS